MILQFVQFRIVGGEKGFRRVGGVVEIFGDAPGDGDAVVGGSPSSYLIQQDEAAGGDVVDNAGRLVHFYHKSRFAAAEVVGSAYPGEYLIGQGDPGCAAGYETAHMRHQ